MSLQRERLTALLTESALTSVELVIAPPGYGKIRRHRFRGRVYRAS